MPCAILPATSKRKLQFLQQKDREEKGENGLDSVPPIFSIAGTLFGLPDWD